jgi:hypothetical protein
MMAMSTKLAGREEGKVGKGDGDGNKKMTTRQQRDNNETT